MNLESWYSLSGNPVDVKAEITSEVKTLEDRSIIIGTDSQRFGNRTEFVTAIIVTRPRRGSRVFYRRVKDLNKLGLREKLFKEAWFSIEVAMELSSIIPIMVCI